MKRRAARLTQQTGVPEPKTRSIRVNISDVYGGMIASRGEMDAQLAELAASIARHGLLQPIVVRRNSEAGRYALVCGARRLAACRMMGFREIEALLVEADEAEAAACFLEEHMTHCPASFLDEAQAAQRADARAVVERMAMGAGALARRLRLLALPECVAACVRENGLSLAQAEPLLNVLGVDRQMEAASIIAARALTPAQARRLVFGPSGRAKKPETHAEAGQPVAMGRRRAIRAAVEEASRLAERMRTHGVDASVAVHSQERGLCIQILILNRENGQKRTAEQDLEN